MIDLAFLRGWPVAVMGLGRSGLATAAALQANGAEVWAWDDDAGRRAEAGAAGIPLVDLHTCPLDGVAALVLAPGIPHTHPKPHPVAARVRCAGLPVIGDVELLARSEREARWVGITGTNGKSTTTSLIGHILHRAGYSVAVGGNLGTPALALPALGPQGVYVLELSSYQLETTFSAPFSVALLLNITPDHLDRHGGMAGYIHAKAQIFAQDPAPQVVVLGVDDAPCRALWEKLRERPVRVIPISTEGPVPGGVGVVQGWLVDDSEDENARVFALNEAPCLPGSHNAQNAAAAWATARSLGLHPNLIADGLRSFPGLAHRQQRAGESGGVLFVNDSKATNADAAAKALGCYDPIYWILGGRPKDTGLAGLEPFMPRVRHAFLIGEAAEAFAGWLQGQGVAFTHCGTLDRATAAAAALARSEKLPGACVLLSPACASFDQYANFEVRGLAFMAQVDGLIGGESP